MSPTNEGDQLQPPVPEAPESGPARADPEGALAVHGHGLDPELSGITRDRLEPLPDQAQQGPFDRSGPEGALGVGQEVQDGLVGQPLRGAEGAEGALLQAEEA